MKASFQGFSLLAAAICLLTANAADAGFQVTLTAGASSVTIMDGGAGDDDGMVNGEISVGQTAPGYTVGAYTFRSLLTMTNSSGTPTLAYVDSGINRITGTGATTVSIYASANGFTMPASPPDIIAFSGSTAQFLSGTTSGNTLDHSYTAYYDASNAMSSTGTGTVIGSGGPTTISAPGGNSNLSDTQVQPFNTTPYALNLELVAVLNNSGTNIVDLDGSVEVHPTPEPASMALLGLGGLLAGAGVMRRKRKTAEELVA